MNNNITIFDHALLKHKISYMRNKNTNTKEFRELVSEIGGLMVYEFTRDLPLRNIEIETPICKTSAYELANDVVLVPIMRAGMGMVEGILKLIPTAKVGHIGLRRNERTLLPATYYSKLPNTIVTSTVLLVDPMLATGGSAVEAVNILKAKGCKDIIYIGLVGAPEGVKALSEAHPDVRIYLAALDEGLNERGYIVPGLGDCGDRIFGTR